MRRILSFDRGGVRGIIPAVLLASLERSTGRVARETFDLVAGTSTGAVLAAGHRRTTLPREYRRLGPG